MTMPTRFQWLGRYAKATALAVGFAITGLAMNAGDRPSGAWAQSSNPTVASVLAAMSSGQPMSQSMQQSLVSYLNSNPGSAASFVNSLVSSGGASGGAAGASLTANLAQAIVSLPGLNPGVQTSVGTGLGQAAGVLAANGFGGSANSILSKVPATGNMAAGATTGMAQAIAAVPVGPTGISTAGALATAAAGTPAAGLVTNAGNQASGPGFQAPPPTILNPNQINGCGSGQAGSCN
jgi:hypothetical protein